jgi:predicted lipid-binding transport protein (Tim44 family)
MENGSFPADLILFGMVALFLVLRLRSILGRRTGYERPPQPLDPRSAQGAGPANGQAAGPLIEGHAEPAAVPGVPDAASPAGQALARMRQIDRRFDPAAFLQGAQAAFRMIVTAFATGDRATLNNLLTPETAGAFGIAIADREKAGQTQKTEIRGIEKTEIEEAGLNGSVASITVRFVSDQTNITYGSGGEVVSGTDAVTEITDVWTFERDLTSADPTWRLASARSA